MSIVTDGEIQPLMATAIFAYENNQINKALNLFEQLYRTDVAEACLYLSLIYEDGGQDIEKNAEISKFWRARYIALLIREAESGNINSKFLLGKIFQYADGAPKDEKKAVSIYTELSEAGHAAAQFHLAMLYWHGWCGCLFDAEKSDYWLDQAVANKWPEALYMKALRMKDITTDEHIFQSLLEESAALGFWPAQMHIQQQKGKAKLHSL